MSEQDVEQKTISTGTSKVIKFSPGVPRGAATVDGTKPEHPSGNYVAGFQVEPLFKKQLPNAGPRHAPFTSTREIPEEDTDMPSLSSSAVGTHVRSTSSSKK